MCLKCACFPHSVNGNSAEEMRICACLVAAKTVFPFTEWANQGHFDDLIGILDRIHQTDAARPPSLRGGDRFAE
jgi:hypothetical protein